MDYPPLLPAGLHPRTWAELQTLCVDGFPLSQSRTAIFTGLRGIIDALCTEGVVGELWVDGSFLSSKIDPGDVDFVLSIAPDVYMLGTPTRQALIHRLATTDPAERAAIKQAFGCDPYVFFDAPVPVGAWNARAYWLKQFGYDRSNNVKGIAVLSLPGGVQ